MADVPVPQPICHRHVAVLRVSDAKVIDRIRAVVPIDHFVLARISDRELVVDPSRIGQLAQLLTDKGMAPLMKRARGAEPSVRTRDSDARERSPSAGTDDPTVALRRRTR